MALGGPSADGYYAVVYVELLYSCRIKIIMLCIVTYVKRETAKRKTIKLKKFDDIGWIFFFVCRKKN